MIDTYRLNGFVSAMETIRFLINAFEQFDRVDYGRLGKKHTSCAVMRQIHISSLQDLTFFPILFFAIITSFYLTHD